MLTVPGFVELNDRLFAAGRYTDEWADVLGAPAAREPPALLFPARIRSATRRLLRMEIGPLPLELLEARAELGKAILEITASADPTGRRRSLLDAISYLHLARTVPPQQLIRLLNGLLIASSRPCA